ncbi:MAG: tryptophan--tRNA ligase [candidate division Zixibacteria bacterium]|nr:tryptophan--tRNA ligase [candidate division Zixibacteria bacterium]
MKEILLSGMKPSGQTGRAHLGNYEGALRNWVRLQDEGKYDLFFCIVDWHFLTAGYNDTKTLKSQITEMALDYLSAGLKPEKCALFIQSEVKEHAELHLLFSMITPVPWLERVPTYKDQVEQKGLDSYGFLGYPVLQAADILVYKANVVPVGKDQLPHIELTREIARRFNHLYGDTLPEPEGLLAQFPNIPGIDGRKMSKSYGNDIKLADTSEDTIAKLKKMYTDPQKLRRGDPGHPDVCPVYMLHQIYNKQHEEIIEPCKSGQLGCVDCKMNVAKHLNESLAPIRQKRMELAKDTDKVWDILKDGGNRARETASRTLADVRKAMKIDWQ